MACARDLDVPEGRYWDVCCGALTLAKAVRLSGEEKDLENWGMSVAVFPTLRLQLGVTGGGVAVVLAPWSKAGHPDPQQAPLACTVPEGKPGAPDG